MCCHLTGLWSFLKFSNIFEISSNPFLEAKTNQNNLKTGLPDTTFHGLLENAFQANQLFDVTWSSVHTSLLVSHSEDMVTTLTKIFPSFFFNFA